MSSAGCPRCPKDRVKALKWAEGARPAGSVATENAGSPGVSPPAPPVSTGPCGESGAGKSPDMALGRASRSACGSALNDPLVELAIHDIDRAVDLGVRHAQSMRNQLHQKIDPLDEGSASSHCPRRR